MAQFRNIFPVDLQTGYKDPVPLMQPVGEGDAKGVRVGASVTNNGAEVDLGGQCVGKVIRADGSTVPLTGTISGNQAYVTLDQTCCAIKGPIQVAVVWVSGTIITTLVIAYGTVVNTITGNTVQPSTPIPDLTQLLAEIDAMRQATAAAEAAATKAVRYDTTQELTATQMARARNNISAAPESMIVNSAVAFNESTDYTFGQYVTYNDRLYRFIADHPAGAWNSAHVVQTNAGFELANGAAIIAHEFSAEMNYVRGDYVIRGRGLYRFINGHPAGEWKDSDVAGVTMANELNYTAVKATIVQSFSDAQQAQARANIGAAAAADMTAAETLLGNTALPTTAQTVTGAIAEHEADVVDLKSALNRDTGYLMYDNLLSVPLVQGARGTNQAISSNSKYVTSKDILLYQAGTQIAVTISDGINGIVTEWNQDGSYVGNVGSFAHTIDYTFTSKIIGLTFKKANNGDLTPSDVSITVRMRTGFSDNVEKLNQNGNNIDYILYGNPVSFPLVQGVRGINQLILGDSAYVTTQNLLSYKAGTTISVAVNSSGVLAAISEWTKAGAFVRTGPWVSGLNYTFSSNDITISFKRSNGSDLSANDVSITTSITTPFSQRNSETDKMLAAYENNFEDVPLSEYVQGYYNQNAVAQQSDTFAHTEMLIPVKTETYRFPISSTYKVSVYTWDYSGGVYSNFSQTGYITGNTDVQVGSGKAMSATICRVDGADIDASEIDYTYYKLSSIGNSAIKEWTPKKVACIGDSLTQGVDVGSHVIAENYPYFMANMLNCSVINCGVAGADTKEYWHDNYDDYTFDSSIDTVLIMLGTNGGGIPDTLSTDVVPYGYTYANYADTYCGCYCKIIMKIIEDTQNRAQVFLITPPYSTYSTAQLNRVKEARETIKKVGEYFNIPVIDVFGECGMGAYNADVFRPHDGCHFNAKGYHRLGTFIGSKVKSMHSIWMLTDEYDDETPVT